MGFGVLLKTTFYIGSYVHLPYPYRFQNISYVMVRLESVSLAPPALQLTRMRAIQARIEWHSFWIYVASTHVVPEPGCPRHPGNSEDATGDDDGEDATGMTTARMRLGMTTARIRLLGMTTTARACLLARWLGCLE